MKHGGAVETIAAKWRGTWSPCCKCSWRRKGADLAYLIATFASLLTCASANKIGPADDHFVRLRSIRGACAQIAKLWPSIEPRASILKK